MAKITINTKKVQPAHSGARRDYIKPGFYQFKVVDYSDKSSAGGKVMHAFTSEVISKGDQAGKKITDRFAMPRNSKESQFPVERLLAFLIACGAKTGGTINAEGSKLVGRTFYAEVFDQQEEARQGADGKNYPARVVSTLAYPDPKEEDEEEEDEEDDEEDEDEEDEEDEDEEEEEPAPKARRSSARSSRKATASSNRPGKSESSASRSSKSKAPAKSSRKSRDEEEDFPFDD